MCFCNNDINVTEKFQVTISQYTQILSNRYIWQRDSIYSIIRPTLASLFTEEPYI